MATVESIRMFNDILQEVAHSHHPYPHKLKFVNHSQKLYLESEKELRAYLESSLTPEAFAELCQRVDQWGDESRLCELLIGLIQYAEKQMDKHVEIFNETLQLINKICEMEREALAPYAESAIDKCSLLVYDSYQLLRSIRKKVVQLSQQYHFPYLYETPEGNYRLRSCYLTTYKNLNVVMDDFQILGETLWFIRHYEYIANKKG